MLFSPLEMLPNFIRRGNNLKWKTWVLQIVRTHVVALRPLLTCPLSKSFKLCSSIPHKENRNGVNRMQVLIWFHSMKLFLIFFWKGLESIVPLDYHLENGLFQTTWNINNILILGFEETSVPHCIIYYLKYIKVNLVILPLKFLHLKLGLMMSDSNIITSIFK